MKKIIVFSEVIWKRPEFVTRKIQTGNDEYWLNISFKNRNGVWSVILDLNNLEIRTDGQIYSRAVKLSFIADELINSFIEVGMKFTLSEGPYAIIGKGRIIEIKKFE